jgi:hypothetical protein
VLVLREGLQDLNGMKLFHMSTRRR